MADTLNDIEVQDEDWTDVYTVTGITLGSSITINNKGGYSLLIQEAPTKPLADSPHGILLASYETGANNATIIAGSSGVWLRATKGACDVNVQEV